MRTVRFPALRSWRLAAAALCVGASMASAQSAPPELPSVRIEQGRLSARFLPVSKPFKITGSAASAAGTADGVHVRVVDLTAKVSVDSSCWIRADAAAKDFSVPVGALALRHRYRLQFTFASSFDDGVVAKAAEATVRKLATASSGVAISTRVADRALASELLGAIAPPSDTSVHWLVPLPDGGCRVVRSLGDATGSPGVAAALADVRRLASADADRISAAIAVESKVRDAAQRAEGDLAAARKAVATASLGADVSRLVAVLDAAAKQPPTTGVAVRRPDAASVAALGAALRRAGAVELDPVIFDRLNAVASAEPAGPITAADRTSLIRTLDLFNDLAAANENYSAKQKELKDGAAAAQQFMQPLNEAIRHVYRSFGQSTFDAQSWDTEASTDALQVGTAIGGAGAWLSNGEGARRDGFMFVALRFYLAPVDRSLPLPWSEQKARFSVDIGSLYGSTLSYLGQKQREAFGGLTPTLGGSFDVNTKLALSAGIVLFRQPSVNPAAKDVTNLRIAPYVGLSLDADVLNRLKGLLSDKKS